MSTAKAISTDELLASMGQEVGISDWIEIDQARINAFADCTEDHQFIHVDPEAAATTHSGEPSRMGF